MRGAMKQGRGMCGTFKVFNLMYLHILCAGMVYITLWYVLGQNLVFYLIFYLLFLFTFLSKKNEKAYFNWRLSCEALKCCSKYTTVQSFWIFYFPINLQRLRSDLSQLAGIQILTLFPHLCNSFLSIDYPQYFEPFIWVLMKETL